MRRLVLLFTLLAGVLGAGGPAAGAERWGWLGVRIRDLSEQEMEELTVKLGLGEGYGVAIAEVIANAPAAGADLKAGDVVVAIAGRPVVETRALQRIVGATEAGRELALVVLRDGWRREVRLRVGEMPPEVVAERVAAEFGFFVREPSADEGAAAGSRAPVVAAVGERSPAARGGLSVGDRILAVNDGETGSVEGFRRRFQDLLLRDPIRLRVQRRGEPLSLLLPPARPALPAH